MHRLVVRRFFNLHKCPAGTVHKCYNVVDCVPWLSCNYLFVLLNPFTFFTQTLNAPVLWRPSVCPREVNCWRCWNYNYTPGCYRDGQAGVLWARFTPFFQLILSSLLSSTWFTALLCFFLYFLSIIYNNINGDMQYMLFCSLIFHSTVCLRDILMSAHKVPHQFLNIYRRFHLWICNKVGFCPLLFLFLLRWSYCFCPSFY